MSAGDHVVTQAMGGKGLKACWHVNTLACMAREHVSAENTLAREHVSTQDTLASEHVSTQDTLACEHVSTQGMLAPEDVFRTQGTQLSRLRVIMCHLHYEHRTLLFPRLLNHQLVFFHTPS